MASSTGISVAFPVLIDDDDIENSLDHMTMQDGPPHSSVGRNGQVHSDDAFLSDWMTLDDSANTEGDAALSSEHDTISIASDDTDDTIAEDAEFPTNCEAAKIPRHMIC